MLKTTFILSAAALLLFTGSCRKTATGPIYTGKIIQGICGQITVQFTDGTPLGQNGWINESDDKKTKYDRVFRIANPCDIGNNPDSGSFRFHIVPLRPQNCAQCLAYVATPDTAYAIEIVR